MCAYVSCDWLRRWHCAMLVFVSLLLPLRRRSPRAHLLCAARRVDAKVLKRVRDGTIMYSISQYRYLSLRTLT